jgi:hypothetical protein
MPRIVLEIQSDSGSDWSLQDLENLVDHLVNVIHDDHAACAMGENPPVVSILETEE